MAPEQFSGGNVDAEVYRQVLKEPA